MQRSTWTLLIVAPASFSRWADQNSSVTAKANRLTRSVVSNG
jgi:hypothetical protein